MAHADYYRCGHCGAADSFTGAPVPERHRVTGSWYLTLTCGLCGHVGSVPSSAQEADEAQAALDAGEPLPAVGAD